MEILSWVPVMVMMRLRCVSKSWNSLIFNPTFIKLHLERSSRNTDILLTFRAFHDKETGDICLVYWRALHPPFTMLFGTDSINSRIYESWMSAMACGDVTMLDNCGGVEVVLYNTRDNKILNRLVIEELLGSRYYSYDYCQSLVLPFGN
ncbi:hypothetical protein JHK84_032900 [Glycine max]|nr:hypothetical protein JHK85_033280 [Glycine max]KAG4984972.1 hypothetical protein JHK86_032663 [Glycine max]KAG5139132.1 hypothetical protein JHK84_032900 [Glycine max]